MAFRLADVKKTVRSRSDGHRYIHCALYKFPEQKILLIIVLRFADRGVQ